MVIIRLLREVDFGKNEKSVCRESVECRAGLQPLSFLAAGRMRQVMFSGMAFTKLVSRVDAGQPRRLSLGLRMPALAKALAWFRLPTEYILGKQDSITIEKFRARLLEDRPCAIADAYIFNGPSFIFKTAPTQEQVVCRYIGSKLGLSSKNIKIVGSAHTGFSLSPDTPFVPFSEKSDVDFIVVDEDLFDTVWFTMVSWSYPKRYYHAVPDRRWLWKRQDDVFWGCFDPKNLAGQTIKWKPASLNAVRDFRVNWFDTFQSLSQFSMLAPRTVGGRLYRSWDHARAYHVMGLEKLRRTIERLKNDIQLY